MTRRAPKAAATGQRVGRQAKQNNKEEFPIIYKKDELAFNKKDLQLLDEVILLPDKNDLPPLSKTDIPVSNNVVNCADAENFDTKGRLTSHPTSFLSLPGEIRNQIYELAFPRQDFEIRKIKKSTGLSYWRYLRERSTLDPRFGWGCLAQTANSGWMSFFWKPRVSEKSTRVRRMQNIKRRTVDGVILPIQYTNSLLSMLSTCHQVRNEATTVFYGKSSFGFTSLHVMRRFLSSIGPMAAAAIQRIYIQHATYGEPCRTKDVHWKTAHDERWDEFCQDIGTCLPGLKELRVLLQVNERPLRVDLAEDWVGPLLAFQRLRLAAFGLELVAGWCNSRKEKELNECSEVVRKLVLGDAYQEQIGESKMHGKGPQGIHIPKAVSCLVIR